MNGWRLMVAATWIVLPTSTGGFLNRLMLAATRARAVHEDRVAVGLGARHVLDRDIAAGAGPVLDDDGAAGERPHLLGEIAHQHVGAAAGRERADEMDVLGRIVAAARGSAGATTRPASSSASRRIPTRMRICVSSRGTTTPALMERPDFRVAARSRRLFLERFLAGLAELPAARSARRRTSVSASSMAEIGRCKKIIGSPRESTSERRRFSSISGPRMKPRTSGAGSQPNRTRM